MIWLDDPHIRAPVFPAVWTVDTPLRPANLQERKLARHAIARQVIATQFALPLSQIAIDHDPSGRPFLPRANRIGISYATRAGRVIVALAEGRIGADIELIEPLADIPWNVLHPLEREDLDSGSRPAVAEAFYRIWAAKEAWLKADGTGLLTEPSSFAIRTRDDKVWHATDDRFKIETRIIRRGAEQFAAAIAYQT